MRRHSRAAAATSIALVAAALVGCSAGGSEQGASTDKLRQESITLEDGRTVQCVIYASGYKGGLSCDWEGAQR